MRLGLGHGLGGNPFAVFLRAEWRARWPAHLVLVAVAAVTIAAAVAPLTGAARSETAFHRLRVATRASDVVIDDPDTQTDPAAAVSKVGGIDGVEGAAAEVELSVRPAGTDYFPDYDLYPIAPLLAQSGDTVNRPLITSGRAVDPGRPDEVALSEHLAAALHVKVGDTVALESMTTHWVDLANNGGDPGPPDGPRVNVKVVGVSRTPADFGRWKGVLHLAPAFVQRYGGQLNVYSGVHARLSPAALREARLGRLPVRDGAEVGPSPFADDAATDDGLGTIGAALRLVAAAAALAGAVATALVLARLARAMLRDQPTLMALGWTNRQLVEATALSLVPSLLAGVVLGVVAGAMTSPLTLVGLARGVDPNPGSVLVDRAVIFGAVATGVVFGLLMVALIARQAASSRGKRARPFGRRVPLRRPMPVMLGLRHASGGAIVAAAAGLAAAVVALVVSSSIGRLQSDPTLFGQGTARVIDGGESVQTYDRAMRRLETDDRVAMLAGIHISFGISAAGSDELTTLAYDLRRGDLGASVVHGRLARQPDEVALGPATLDRLGKRVGDVIELHADRGTAGFRIVGSVLFPEGDFAHDDGVALTTSGADRLLGNVHEAGQLHQVAFQWTDGVDARAADESLAAAGLTVLTNDNALKPAAVKNLGEVEALPRYLAVFVCALSLVTLGYALAIGVRLRARELATLRALGATPRANAAIVTCDGLTMIGLAIAVGVPLGLAVSARVWTPIANRAHVLVRVASPWTWIALLLLVTVVATGALTAIPARGARRLRVADALRIE